MALMQPSSGMREKAGDTSDHPKPLMQRGAMTEIYQSKTIGTMKDLINFFVKDYQSEGFTGREWVMGILAVMAIIMACVMAEFLGA